MTETFGSMVDDALARARQVDDEWSAVLGTISNVEPRMLGISGHGRPLVISGIDQTIN